MNQDTFIFEELYQKELNRIYQELGYQIIQRIKGKENKYYDVILKKDNKEAKIEEKALEYYHEDCPIELIQNIWPFDLGWFYETKAEFIHFFYYQDLQPKILYQVDFQRLKNNLASFFKQKEWWRYIKARFSIINYGITLNLCIKWDYLKKEKCAFILKSWMDK